MNWAGKRILITRAEKDFEAERKKWKAVGAEALPYPCIKTIFTDFKLKPNNFDWVIFTSQNAVAACKKLKFQATTKLACIGEKTAASCKKNLNRTPDFVPTISTAQALGEQLPFAPKEKLLLPQSNLARKDLRSALKERGAKFTAIETYKTVIGTGGIDLLVEHKINPIDAIYFASPSAVTNFKTRIESEGGSLKFFASAKFLCIGSTTLNTCIKTMKQCVNHISQLNSIDRDPSE